MVSATSRQERREQLRAEVEPVECAEGHDAVEMDLQTGAGSAVRYECPSCDRVVRYVMKLWDEGYRKEELASPSA
jgi:hypothetical protein